MRRSGCASPASDRFAVVHTAVDVHEHEGVHVAHILEVFFNATDFIVNAVFNCDWEIDQNRACLLQDGCNQVDAHIQRRKGLQN